MLWTRRPRWLAGDESLRRQDAHHDAGALGYALGRGDMRLKLTQRVTSCAPALPERNTTSLATAAATGASRRRSRLHSGSVPPMQPVNGKGASTRRRRSPRTHGQGIEQDGEELRTWPAAMAG